MIRSNSIRFSEYILQLVIIYSSFCVIQSSVSLYLDWITAGLDRITLDWIGSPVNQIIFIKWLYTQSHEFMLSLCWVYGDSLLYWITLDYTGLHWLILAWHRFMPLFLNPCENNFDLWNDIWDMGCQKKLICAFLVTNIFHIY